MLRNNYVLSLKAKWLVFTTIIGDVGLNRTGFVCKVITNADKSRERSFCGNYRSADSQLISPVKSKVSYMLSVGLLWVSK